MSGIDHAYTEYAAAASRCVQTLRELRTSEEHTPLLLRDLPESPEKSDLMRRRFVLGMSMCPNSRLIEN